MSSDDRLILLDTNLAAIPERLLLAHARGEVLFIVGAGVSQASNLPDFRGLALKVYEQLDEVVHDVISNVPLTACNQWDVDTSSLTFQQAAEVHRFISGDYDVVLGMLERRIDGQSSGTSLVRQTITAILRSKEIKPSAIHKALMRLADRGGPLTIVTTNFELLLENATSPRTQTYALGGIPRPGRNSDFAGVLHIHGALDRNPARVSDLIVTDQDFGEFYLRRRIVPDFIYDAARLFNLVLVGYSANDPPMRYLLNAVAADGSRFDDLKERFAFIGDSSFDPINQEDWKGRGITPINYDSTNKHSVLLKTLQRWADFFAYSSKSNVIDTNIKRIVKTKFSEANDEDRDLFEHIVRRGDSRERTRLSALASRFKADFDWLNAITEIISSHDRGRH